MSRTWGGGQTVPMVYVGFKGTTTKTNQGFIDMVNLHYNQSFTDVTESLNWVQNQNYYTNFGGISTSCIIAYNTGYTLDGTTQIGDLAVAVDMTKPYSEKYGGLDWWSGPNEDTMYVIGFPNDIPTLPQGYSFLIDDNGYYMLDNNGDYLIVPM